MIAPLSHSLGRHKWKVICVVHSPRPSRHQEIGHLGVSAESLRNSGEYRDSFLGLLGQE